MLKNKRILISGGGTGGHIFPALSIANALRRREPSVEILFVGADNRMEMERVPAAGYEIVGLPVAGFVRKNLLKNVPVLFKLYKSLAKAKKVLKEFRPDICIGVGGYASGPMLKQAQKRGIPTLLQEQNSYAGVTNKLLAKEAKAICVAYTGMERFFPEDRITMTGNPVRASLFECGLTQQEAKAQLGFDPSRPLVLVVGGSLGARTINDSVGSGLEVLTMNGTQVLWQTGKFYADECLSLAEGYDDVQATAFIADMALAYRAADLVVSRAGAGTISELQLLGKATILVPSPNVAEDHQRKNGQALVDVGAAEMVLDADAREQLVEKVRELLDEPTRRSALSANISRMALHGSDEKIVDIIEKILN